ncbi:MAG: M48 family metallopeptidase [Gammaproteobacteria bacterium]|nr:M48 family metallopeptidase [Gammaproteobacteria bacterium]
MNATRLRSQHDKEMFDQLLEDPTVKKVNEQIAKREGKGNLGIRRHLLSTSVRLTRTMAAPLHKIAATCAEQLGLTIPLELYVFPSATYNAACFKPEEGRLFVMFASSLLERFEPGELKFVMGHELGHHLYNHHDLPIGYVLRGKTPPSAKLALALTSWSRFAEVSADRAGAYCANDLETVAHSLFKLASGLSGQLVNFSLAEFMQQVDEMQMEVSEPGQGAPTEDWFLTHPFSPLRVKALKLFDESELAREDGTSVADLEASIHSLMSLMEPSYLEARTDTAEIMRRLLFAGAIAVAAESAGISPAEIAVFETFFGNRSFSDKLDVEQIQAELPERISQARTHTSRPQRMQVIHDLCTIARADGHSTEAEVDLLLEIGKNLSIPGAFILQSLASNPELD